MPPLVASRVTTGDWRDEWTWIHIQSAGVACQSQAIQTAGRYEETMAGKEMRSFTEEGGEVTADRRFAAQQRQPQTTAEEVASWSSTWADLYLIHDEGDNKLTYMIMIYEVKGTGEERNNGGEWVIAGDDIACRYVGAGYTKLTMGAAPVMRPKQAFRSQETAEWMGLHPGDEEEGEDERYE
ncbi:hypothetical protein R3P38DRAFT_2802660 [Favolaschia claudopus]|uniref:Uncharacterized protein n=1 Tax=Favolaschia claudopus TaxID=2862362 RepID=A0AAV9ZU06_9AGAR